MHVWNKRLISPRRRRKTSRFLPDGSWFFRSNHNSHLIARFSGDYSGNAGEEEWSEEEQPREGQTILLILSVTRFREFVCPETQKGEEPIIMLSEDEIYLYAAARGWRASIDLLHAGEYIRGVFLSRPGGTERHLWGPLLAIQGLTVEECLASLECLGACRDHDDTHGLPC